MACSGSELKHMRSSPSHLPACATHGTLKRPTPPANNSSISCRLRRLGFVLWACPVRVLARTENVQLGTNQRGPTFPRHRVYKAAQTAAHTPFSLSLCTDQRKTKMTSRPDSNRDRWRRRGRGHRPTALFRATGERSCKSWRALFWASVRLLSRLPGSG